MSNQLHPVTHFERKKLVWRRIFEGYYNMDKDVLEIIARFLLSFGMLYLVLDGAVVGWIGVPSATITSGIDLAAAFEALRESQTDDSRQATWEDNE